VALLVLFLEAVEEEEEEEGGGEGEEGDV